MKWQRHSGYVQRADGMFRITRVVMPHGDVYTLWIFNGGGPTGWKMHRPNFKTGAEAVEVADNWTE